VDPPGAAPAKNAGFAVPLMLMICGESGASSVSVTLATRAPVASGVNVSTIVHVPLTGIAALHVGSEKLNSFMFAPPNATPVMCRAAVPVFFTVTLIGALVPCVIVPKSGLLGVTVTAAEGGAIAFPLTLMAWGESGASSVSITLAVRNPAASDKNVTVIAHEALTGMALLQAGSEKLKSFVFAPPSATFVMCSAALPTFVMVTVIEVVDPTVVEPKSRLPGMSVTAGAGARPVPFN